VAVFCSTFCQANAQSRQTAEASGARAPELKESKSSSDTELSPAALFKKVSPSVFELILRDDSGKPVAFGSGVVVGPHTLVTNKHVLVMGSRVTVKTATDKELLAKLTCSYPDQDIVQLEVPDLNAPAVPTRPSKSLEVGERVYAIGSPDALEKSLSEGLISGLRWQGDVCHIQTSVQTLHGSSGGGLFDGHGKLIGLTTISIEGAFDLALSTDLISDLSKYPVPETARLSDPKYRGKLAYLTARGYGRFAGTLPPVMGDKLLPIEKQYVALAAQLDPDNSDVLTSQASLSYMQHDVKTATTLLERARQLDPKNVEVCSNLVSIYAVTGQMDKALSAYDQLAKLDETQALKTAKKLMKSDHIDIAAARKTATGVAGVPPSSVTANAAAAEQVKKLGQEFIEYVVRSVKKNWTYAKPCDLRLSFQISDNGEVSQVQVLHVSGDDAADESARMALMNSAPFMSVPPPVLQGRKFVEAQVRLNNNPRPKPPDIDQRQ